MRVPAFATRAVALALSFLMAGCAATGYSSLTWPADEGEALEDWFATELEPYLAERLTTHPRFRGETITVASMQGDDPQPAPDSLSRAVVQRLTRFLQATPGVNLVWEGGRSAGDCLRREDAHYVLAVDLQQTGPAAHRLVVRALDREDGIWVSGFGQEWNGRLTRAQYARYRQPAVTAETRGLRDYPFRADEGDLLARRLAEQLGADLCGFVGEPLAVHADTDGNPEFVAGIVELVANNLARSPEIRVVRERSAANLLLSGRLYAIDDGLQQFWVQARPARGAAEFPVTDVQAYVERRADSGPVRSVRRAQGADVGAPAAAITGTRPTAGPGDVRLEALRVLTPNDPWMCRRSDPWRRGARVLRTGESLTDDACFALEIEVTGDAEVFLLRRDPAAGLVRMMPARCGPHAQFPARTYGDATLRFPAAPAGWEYALHPAATFRESWFGLAIPAGRAGPELRRHLENLPDRCAADDGAAVDARAWLARLDDLLDTGVALRRLEIPVGRQTARRD